MKTAELTGALLDYWVARATGTGCWQWSDGASVSFADWQKFPSLHTRFTNDSWSRFTPSTSWKQAGPIIDSERMTFATTGTGPRGANGFEPVVAITYTGRRAMEGPTHLTAAMRAYVASKFGDEVPEDDRAAQAASQDTGGKA